MTLNINNVNKMNSMNNIKKSFKIFNPINSFIVKMAQHKVYYTHNYWDDFKFYVKNEHIILGICYADINNPFSRYERIIFLICSFIFSFLLTILFNLISANDTRILISFICGSILESLFDSSIKNILTCGLTQKTYVPTIIRTSIECIGIIISYCICSCLIVTFICILILLLIKIRMIFLFIESKIISFIIVIPIMLIKYHLKRNKEINEKKNISLSEIKTSFSNSLDDIPDVENVEEYDT